MRATASQISVIITTWNSSQFIEPALDSVCAQTLPAAEILVCDDGSTDDTYEIVSRYADSRVQWCQGAKHTGFPGANRNRGIDIAKGQWLAFMDHDDIWYPEKLDHQFRAMLSSGARACCTNAWSFCPGRENLYNFHSIPSGPISFIDLIEANLVICSSAIIDSHLIDKIGGFPEDLIYDDYAFWLRVCCYTNFDYIDKPMVRYRNSPASSISGRKTSEQSRQIQVFETFLSWCLETNDPTLGSYIELGEKKLNFLRSE